MTKDFLSYIKPNTGYGKNIGYQCVLYKNSNQYHTM